MLRPFNMRGLAFAILAGFTIALIVAVGHVYAQDTTVVTTPRSTTISAAGLYDTAIPYVLTFLSAVVSGILAWLAAMLQRWTGIKIEAQHREALHSAAMSGVSAALTRYRKSAEQVRFEVSSPVIVDAVDWVQRSVPDALKALGVSPEDITKLVLSKISILAETPSSTAGQNANAV